MKMCEADFLIAAAQTIRSYCQSGVHKYEMCDDCPFFILVNPSGECELSGVTVPSEWELPND